MTIIGEAIKSAVNQSGSLIELYDTNYRETDIAVCCYLLNIINHAQMKKQLPWFNASQHKLVRQAIVSNWRIMVQLKLALLSSVKHGYRRHTLRTYDLSNINNKLFLRLKHRGHFEHRGLVDVALPTLTEVFVAADQAILEVRSHAKTFVCRRMRFIYQHNSMTAEDLINELLERALYTYYLNVPYKSPAHVKNAMRRAMTNYGLNLIKYFQANKRRRLTGHNKGESFTTSVVPLYYMSPHSDGAVLKEAENSPYVIRNSDFYNIRTFEIQRLIETLPRTYLIKNMPVQYRAAKLLLGRVTPEFVHYCREHRIIDTVIEIDNIPVKKYHRAVSNFLNIEPKEFKLFVSQLHKEVRENLVM